MSRYLYFTLSDSDIPTHHLSEELPLGPHLKLSIAQIWKIAQKEERMYVGLRCENGKVVELNVIGDLDEIPHDQICVSLSDFLSDERGDLPTQPLDD